MTPRRWMWSAVLLVAALVSACSEPPPPKTTDPVQGRAAEIRDGIAYVPRTERRYSGLLRTYYWNGDYVRATYRNGKVHGSWTRYSAEGEVLQHVCFDHGRAIECR
jgi:hypothetical protein